MVVTLLCRLQSISKHNWFFYEDTEMSTYGHCVKLIYCYCTLGNDYFLDGFGDWLSKLGQFGLTECI